MLPLLLIQTGEAPDPIRVRYGGFADWFGAAMRVQSAQMLVVRVDAGAPLPAARTVAGAVITGSAAMVTEPADWSRHTAQWLREAREQCLPLFGVCYGHQLMAAAFGGTVGWLPGGREIGTLPITRATRGPAPESGWMRGLPATFPAHTTHRQAVLVPPQAATILAHSERDPCQMLRYAATASSTQFHPEFTAEHMRAYIATRAGALRAEGFDPDALDAAVEDAECARALLEHFAQDALHPRRDALA